MTDKKPFEIEIIEKPIGEAVVDLNKFREILSKSWNLERAVKDSAKITNLSVITTEEFLDSIWLGLDWGKLIGVFNDIKLNEMKVKCFKVRYRNWPMFKPGAISRDSRKFKLDVEMKDGEDIILIQSLRKDMSFAVKNLVDNMQFTYAKDKWGLDVSDELLADDNKDLNNS